MVLWARELVVSSSGVLRIILLALHAMVFKYLFYFCSFVQVRLMVVWALVSTLLPLSAAII